MFEHAPAAGEQAVRVNALRHAAPMPPALRERVAIDQRDMLEMIGQDARGDQAAHAAADDNRMLPVQFTHSRSPPSDPFSGDFQFCSISILFATGHSGYSSVQRRSARCHKGFERSTEQRHDERVDNE
jgi:hypothetical protein